MKNQRGAGCRPAGDPYPTTGQPNRSSCVKQKSRLEGTKEEGRAGNTYCARRKWRRRKSVYDFSCRARDVPPEEIYIKGGISAAWEIIVRY